MGAEYHQRRHYHTHAKGAQEAHEAIRPTDMRRETISGSSQEKRLYDLIWKRTIACQMADAQMEKTTVSIDVASASSNINSSSNECFVANGEVIKFEGFLKVYRESQENDGDLEEDTSILPPVKEGETLTAQEVTASERFTQQPPRYTEASLVHKMEELGIGRPSTYAPTISTIQQRQYVAKGEKEGTPREYRVLKLQGDTGEITKQINTEKPVRRRANSSRPTSASWSMTFWRRISQKSWTIISRPTLRKTSTPWPTGRKLDRTHSPLLRRFRTPGGENPQPKDRTQGGRARIGRRPRVGPRRIGENWPLRTDGADGSGQR